MNVIYMDLNNLTIHAVVLTDCCINLCKINIIRTFAHFIFLN